MFINFSLFFSNLQVDIGHGTKPSRIGVTLSLQRFYYLRLFQDYMLDSELLQRSKHIGGPYNIFRHYDDSIIIFHEDSEIRNIINSSHLPPKKKQKQEGACRPNIDHGYCAYEEQSSSYGFNGDRFEYIVLSKTEMKALMDLYEKMEGECHELNGIIPCITTHENQLSYYDCQECCPGGDSILF